MGNKLILVGYMGAGKSSVGKKLAKAMKLKFIDLDGAIESASGKSPAEWIEQHGELAFRKEERTVLLNVLHTGSFVLATGGGTPCYYDNMELMCAHGLCIYLDAAPGFLQSRLLQFKQNRPLIAHIQEEDLAEFIGKHLFERRAFYQKAQLTLSAASVSIDKLVDRVDSFLP